MNRRRGCFTVGQRGTTFTAGSWVNDKNARGVICSGLFYSGSTRNNLLPEREMGK
jgi:hypothetical protein